MQVVVVSGITSFVSATTPTTTIDYYFYHCHHHNNYFYYCSCYYYFAWLQTTKFRNDALGVCVRPC